MSPNHCSISHINLTKNCGRPRAVILMAEKPSSELPPFTGKTERISKANTLNLYSFFLKNDY